CTTDGLSYEDDSGYYRGGFDVW
nr:immunoglobulin heavy chain junction region [Macaca mulatta]MOV57139.1 immunoglobulin heavy chain junction region [Macaca mulatta]MOV57455.1 immunoglobulin heavy chain junction region [Macaca mulatta]MOV57778.1 immunoglobulin heavy chain junction region [Macaca mulatta]MOV58267.1 immunoglobulin heavy chain junction region [Macaca mulatta]